MPKSVIYLNSLVENQNPHHLANESYYLVYISDADGVMYPALFTNDSIGKAITRATQNPEDAPPITMGWFKKLLFKLKVCE